MPHLGLEERGEPPLGKARCGAAAPLETLA